MAYHNLTNLQSKSTFHITLYKNSQKGDDNDYLNAYPKGGDEPTGIAGLVEALERELKGIRCEISVIADKIRSG